MARPIAQPTARQAAYAKSLVVLEQARIAYRAATLDAVRAVVSRDVADLDTTLRLVSWLTNDSPLTYDFAGELESELASFPDYAHAQVVRVIVTVRAFGAAADACRAAKR